jgi:hypothetical protein
MDAFDQIQLEPNEIKNIYQNNKEKDPFDTVEFEESWGKSALRSLYQIPSGIAQGFTAPLDLISAVGAGESFDPEEIEHLEAISKREGIPFDKEKYLQAIQGAQEAFPTQGNIEKLVEEKTGFPTQPRTALQKGIKLASTAATLSPGNAIQKGVAGVAAPTVSQGLQKVGVPEALSDIAGLAVSPIAATKTPKIDISKSKKPSGLTERRFESVKKPKEISESRYNKISEQLEVDFKNISDKIIQESPIGKTYSSLKEDSSFKSNVGNLFKDVEDLAENIPNKFSTDIVKKQLNKKIESKVGKSITPSEYDQDYNKFMKKFIKDTPTKNIEAKDLVKQYRMNNKTLGELYESSKSAAYNRAKKDAYLDYNRSISDMIENGFPESEFSNLFKSTNKKWSEIKDAESIGKFFDDLFDGKIQYAKGKKMLAKERVTDSFKRSFGENYPKFIQLTDDLMGTKEAFSLLSKAKEKGLGDLLKTGSAFLLHPSLAKAKVGIDYIKRIYQTLLDKPKLAFTWDKGIREMKKGNYKDAFRNFKLIEDAAEFGKEEIGQSIKSNTQEITNPQ